MTVAKIWAFEIVINFGKYFAFIFLDSSDMNWASLSKSSENKICKNESWDSPDQKIGLCKHVWM